MFCRMNEVKYSKNINFHRFIEAVKSCLPVCHPPECVSNFTKAMKLKILILTFYHIRELTN